MKVVSIDGGKDNPREERKKEVLRILDEFREMVENDEITEFVSCSSRADGGMQLHIACFDVAVAVGMFEIGKSLIIEDFNFGNGE